MSRLLHVLIFALASTALIACAEDEGTDENGSGFSKVYSEVITPGCSCHFNPDHESNLFFGTEQEAYDNLVGVAAAGSACSSDFTRVVAGDPDGSLLYLKISQDDPGCGGRMPLGGTLSADQQEIVRAWIADGAQR